MELTQEQIARAHRMAKRDYEIRSYLYAYLDGDASDDIIELLLEEIGETQIA